MYLLCFKVLFLLFFMQNKMWILHSNNLNQVLKMEKYEPENAFCKMAEINSCAVRMEWVKINARTLPC